MWDKVILRKQVTLKGKRFSLSLLNAGKKLCPS
jgi:hypothetical protein